MNAAKVNARDFSKLAAVAEIAQQTRRESLVIDLLVNNAGFDLFGYFWENYRR